MAGSETILEVLTSDHQAILDLLTRLDHDGDSEDSLREQLVIELVRHFVAEEQYLYPLVRTQFDNGAVLADAAFAQNRETEQALRGLENSHADPEFVSVSLATVRRLFTDHVREQQDELFPALATGVYPAQLTELGDQVLGAEQLAPTRPRAVAAANPALNKFSSIVEGFIDHVRDTYSHRGERAEDIQ